jgi:GxxExxY protein
VYHACVTHELLALKLPSAAQKALPLVYKSVRLGCGFRLGFVVEDLVVVEVKCVEEIQAVHHAQLLTYQKLTGCPAGLLINFNVPVLKNGVRRVLRTT